MKFFVVVSLFVILAVTLSQVEAQVKFNEAKEAHIEPKKSVQFGKLDENAGKARVYDPCNYNPFDHSGCTAACWSVGYYYGGFCSGYDCYCYV